MITRIKTLDLCNPVENKYVVFEENHWILKNKVGCSAKNQPNFWLFGKNPLDDKNPLDRPISSGKKLKRTGSKYI